METISLKMDDGMLKSIDRNLSKNNYSTRTEFIRDSIRRRLLDIEKENVLRKLSELKDALKGKAKISEEEAGERAIRNIAKKLNMSLD